jgi:hypothetical protein
MLGKWPFPNKLSTKPAQAGGLWIRRVLVRAQEGQLKALQRIFVVELFCFSAALGVCSVVSSRSITVTPSLPPIAIVGFSSASVIGSGRGVP